MRILACLEMKLIVILMSALLFAACGGSTPTSPANTSSSPEAPLPSPSPQTDFEKALQYIRNGQYTYVWVFSRKDGKPLEQADSIFLRTNAPQVVDWVTTEDKRKVVAGTNFNLEEGNLELLKRRFVAEDYSNK